MSSPESIAERTPAPEEECPGKVAQRTIFGDIIPQVLATPIEGVPLVDLCGPGAEELDIGEHAHLFATQAAKFQAIIRNRDNWWTDLAHIDVVLRFFMATSQDDLAIGEPEPDELDKLDISYNSLLWLYLVKLLVAFDEEERSNSIVWLGSAWHGRFDKRAVFRVPEIIAEIDDSVERKYVAKRFQVMIYDKYDFHNLKRTIARMCSVIGVNQTECARRSYLAKVDELRRQLWDDDTDPGVIVALWLNGHLAHPLSPLR